MASIPDSPFFSSSSHFFCFSPRFIPPLPSALSVPHYQVKVLYLFLQQRSYWSQDLWLCSGPHLPSQLHCLVPSVMEVQGSLRCCRSLIRQGQSNPDDRKVAKIDGDITHFGESTIAVSTCILNNSRIANLAARRDKRKMQSKRAKLVEKLKRAQHSWQ